MCARLAKLIRTEHTARVVLLKMLCVYISDIVICAVMHIDNEGDRIDAGEL